MLFKNYGADLDVEVVQTVFLLFLCEKGLLDVYIHNVQNHANSAEFRFDTLEGLLSTTNAHAFINCSFDWASTLQGFEFWDKLDDDWRMITDLGLGID